MVGAGTSINESFTITIIIKKESSYWWNGIIKVTYNKLIIHGLVTKYNSEF